MRIPKPFRRRPLRTRLAVVTSAAVALVALGVLAAAYVVIRYEIRNQLDLQLKQQSGTLAQQARTSGTGVLYAECAWLAAPACAQVVPADPAAPGQRGLVLPVTGATRRVAAGTLGAHYSDIVRDGRSLRMLTTPLGHGRALQVAVRSDTVEKGVEQAGLLLGAVGGAGVLLAAGLGYAASRTALRPVSRLTATAERIAATRDPAHRITLPPDEERPQDSRDEITRLATSFNTMLAELEDAVAAQRRLVADASHELRTPLTALRTNAELLARAERLTPAQRDRAAGALGRQLREVTGLVNDLIELARDEEPRQLVERVRLDLLTESCVAAARGHWPATPFTLRTGDVADVTVPGVPARLARLLANLLDNAAKFSPPGAAVEVRLDRRPDAVELTVRDHGPGISDEDRPHVFDRFYRSRQARALPGSGLGLAMARQIARAHGAELTAERPPSGPGALFRLRFPAPG
ncbi:integral membrane sensor signal transduction histidine kinase [Streptomyces mobaraensis NBRC 13819 = DSM 40847]|uniref:histidine kinase n=1 Tax=Streptomyces mobaraensis (strain ATCC 29032 / DSM 40847 / JCM 4168 / NBRC 13819 / NCIMB 11159 / IPCR 16-22) TaxID=1223523 RepID=M3C4R4_STRM1|nr:HAMP domain-containing sensor histidine kinase [Streptomyces mobaraensis]EME98940.1 integral membrane sensor signal transduction histidine kinase [Streptomyces mobaraensis NBRC 13819 = DSM 40847]